MWASAGQLVAFWGPWGLLVIGLSAAVWLYATDRIVSAGRFTEMARDRDFYRDALISALDIAEAHVKREDR